MNKTELIERMQKVLAREFYSHELDEIFDTFELKDFLVALEPLQDTSGYDVEENTK